MSAERFARAAAADWRAEDAEAAPAPQASLMVRRMVGWAGSPACSAEGRALGELAGLVVDRQSGLPQWLLLRDGAGEHRCLPLAGTVGRSRVVHVPYGSAVVTDSPRVPGDGSLSVRDEQALCVFYDVPPTRGAGLDRRERRRTTGLANVEADRVLRWEPAAR